MLEWLRKLLGPGEPYQYCKTCEVLREQLDYERSVNKELTETLTALLKPRPIVAETAANSNQLKPVSMPGGMWSRRRAELERIDRESVKLQRNSPVIAKPDSEIEEVKKPEQRQTIEELEKELGVVEVDSSNDMNEDAG